MASFKTQGEAICIDHVPSDGALTFVIDFLDSDSDAIDLTGRTYEAMIRARSSDTGDPVAEFMIDVEALAGRLTMSLTAEDVGLLVGKTWRWDLAETVGSDDPTILYHGSTIHVEQSVTHA